MPTNQIWNTSGIWGFMLGPQNTHGSWEWNGDNSTIDRYDVYERKREIYRRPCSCLSQEMYIQTCGVDARCKGYSGNATTNITPRRYQDKKNTMKYRRHLVYARSEKRTLTLRMERRQHDYRVMTWVPLKLLVRLFMIGERRVMTFVPRNCLSNNSCDSWDMSQSCGL